MRFRLENSVNMMFSNHCEFPISIQIDQNTEIRFFAKDSRDPAVRLRLHCEVTEETKPPIQVIRALRGIRDGYLVLDNPPQIDLPRKSASGEVLVSPDGALAERWIPSLRELPRGVRPWIDEIGKRLTNVLKSFVQTLRWRNDAFGTHYPFGFGSLAWSEDGEPWIPVPVDLEVSIEPFKSLNLSQKSLETAKALVIRGEREPFCHELIREAKDLAHKAPRSAFLIAISALETGIKSHISRISPDANTIISNVPSPPLEKLLGVVLEDLHARHKIEMRELPLNTEQSAYLKKRVFERNLITHGQGDQVNMTDLAELIKFVSDILYLLDYAHGHTWAKNHLSSRFFSDQSSL